MKPNSVDWSKMRLGKRPDGEVAAELGCTTNAVSEARRKLGIAIFPDPKTTAKADWSKVVFGEEPDADLAARLGVAVMTVTKRRRDLGIPAYQVKR